MPSNSELTLYEILDVLDGPYGWKADLEKLIAALRTRIIQEAIERLPEKRKLYEPVTKREVAEGDEGTMNLEHDLGSSLIFVEDNGHNIAVDEMRAALQAMLTEGEPTKHS